MTVPRGIDRLWFHSTRKCTHLAADLNDLPTLLRLAQAEGDLFRGMPGFSWEDSPSKSVQIIPQCEHCGMICSWGHITAQVTQEKTGVAERWLLGESAPSTENRGWGHDFGEVMARFPGPPGDTGVWTKSEHRLLA